MDAYVEEVYRVVRKMLIGHEKLVSDDIVDLVGNHGLYMLLENHYIEKGPMWDSEMTYILCCEGE